ncbi:39S ribosomal protein L48, mitochondrial-like isoform X2 [Mya arenaria]|nr:39S ribosomal protein L48, mitochondrial-like isoform X2 [Mya arenaria]XP_052766422.1 39S ribosomal protein L48, mitochondrial-like isoform X2 [Mya arenaria]
MDIFRKVVYRNLTFSRIKCLRNSARNFSCSSLMQYKWEPDDLVTEPEIPEYPGVLIKMKGYDFRVLESYAKFVFRTASMLDPEVGRWALPPQKMEMQTLKPNSTTVVETCHLNIYERVVELQNLPSPKLPPLLDMICSHIPEGVNVSVKEATNEDYEARYVPDHTRQKLQSALEELPTRGKS